MRSTYTAGDVGHLEDHGTIAVHVDGTTNVHGIPNTATLVFTSDSRLNDSRTPTAHAASHASGGSDPLNLSGIADPPGTAAALVDDLSGVTNAASARTNLGLGTMATQAASAVAITGGSISGVSISGLSLSSVTITSGTITGITDLAVADGGTGASTMGGARTNLGLGDVATQTASSVAFTGGSITGITDLLVADGGTGSSTASGARTNLGLGTMATQDASAIAVTGGTMSGVTITGLTLTSPTITGGSWTGGTDLAVADGGTGSSTASGARTNLGLGTIATQDSSNVTITGGAISGITDLPLADGGTGASTAANARTNLGLGTMSTQAASAVAITGGTITGTTTGGTIASATIDNTNTVTLKDDHFTIVDNSDTSKTLSFDMANVSTGVDVVIKTPAWTVDTTDIIVVRDAIQTLGNKKVISGALTNSSGITAGVESIGGDTIIPFHATGGFLGLDFVATEFNGGTASLDLRSTQGASLAALSPSLAGDILGGIHIGGSHNTATGLVDCNQIYCVATENFSTDATASGNRWAIWATANTTESKFVALTVDHDGEIIAGSPDTNGAASASRTYSTSALKPEAFFGIKSTQTFTSTFATPTFPAFLRTRATYVAGATMNSATALCQGALVNQTTFKNDPAISGDWVTGVNTLAFGIRDIPTFTVDTSTNVNLGVYKSFNSAPTFNRTNSGTVASAVYNGFNTAPVVGAGMTFGSVVHFQVVDVSNSGTVTTQSAIEIPAMNGATTNIGIRNASSTVYTPKTKTITAVSDSLSATDIQATNIRLNNTSGSSKTLTSAPTVADGTDGQIILLTNTSASDVVIQDQGTLASSNLRLVTTAVTLSTRDNVWLKYDGTVGDWIQISPVTNVI